MTHQPDEAREEALRLAKEAGFNWPEITTTTIEDRLVRLIALVRASQAQPEPPAGWVMVPKEPTQAMLDAAFPPEDIGRSYRADFNRIHAAQYRAMLAAAPSPTGEKG